MSQTVNLGHVVGPGVPNGGTAGQVLKKNSGTNFDTSWSDNSAATIPMSGSDNTSIGNAMSKILPVITGTTNNSGYAIAAGEYFEANGGLYQATASIPVDNAWSSSATALTDHGAVNALNSKINNLIKYADVSSVSFACTTADGGHYYGEVDRGTLGLSGKMLVFAQFTGNFTIDEILSITSSSHKVCMITDSSKSVTRNIRVFYMSE